ncbi:fad-type 2 [Pyrenophora seminiperda CCB06]|uniref:Fad-type 2 n=1 Tax=Pyrenophora seminiperda CCB06 TaxID=1302712 RepID=A0A3M7M9M8_9PLEO|nr:fad-type 2 [Pyrenophora seminiperda CCB06]
MASTATSLLDAPDPLTKEQIIKQLWGILPDQLNYSHYDDPFGAYWRFYNEECKNALHDNGRHVLERTHQDLLDIVHSLQKSETRDEIHRALRSKFTRPHQNENEILDCSIAFAAKIWLMADFGHMQNGHSGGRRLQWESDSLEECLSKGFPSTPLLGHNGVKLQRVFNALNLKRIAGVEVVPTANLLDHLRLYEDDTKLYVFHHVSVLRCQLSNTSFPDGLIDETLRTLALLFPQSDTATGNYCRRLQVSFDVDSQLALCGHLKTDDRQIETFTYWHDRLVVLKQVFDEATPRTLSQWWHDARNGVQWYTFWVAILVVALTLFFGFIQSVEGALQVYSGFKSETH